MIDEKELIKSLEDLTDEYRDRLAKAEIKEHKNFLNGVIGTLIDVTNIIHRQPKIDWISVDERLPEPDKCVLVSYKSVMKWDKEVYSDQIAIIREDGWHWWDELETKVENEIVAWRPLPEPPKGKTE